MNPTECPVCFTDLSTFAADRREVETTAGRLLVCASHPAAEVRDVVRYIEEVRDERR